MTDINYPLLAVTTFIFAASPGPGIVAVLATSISRGARAGAAMSLGEAVGDMSYLILAMAALAGLAQGSGIGNIMLAVRICGGVYLCWLGFRQLRSPPMQVTDTPAGVRNLGMAFAAGYMISITNPKVIVFYLSFLPLFIDLTRIDFQTGTIITVVMFPSVLAGPLLAVAIGKKARDFATGEVSGRWLNRLTGLLLIAVGIALVALI